MMKMDTIIEACMENVINFLAEDQDDDIFRFSVLPSSVKLRKFPNINESRKYPVHEKSLDQLNEIEEMSVDRKLTEENTSSQLKEATEIFVEELGANEAQANMGSIPAKKRRIDLEANVDVDSSSQDSHDSDYEEDDIFDKLTCRYPQHLDTERERIRNKIFKDMHLAIKQIKS